MLKRAPNCEFTERADADSNARGDSAHEISCYNRMGFYTQHGDGSLSGGRLCPLKAHRSSARLARFPHLADVPRNHELMLFFLPVRE